MSQREAVAMKKKVAVIGGGYAGIAAARTLIQHGGGAVAVELFEASHVLGGRARQGTLPASGLTVELGATWFHGTQGNPVYDLAVQHDVINPNLTTPQQQQQQDEGASTTAAAAASTEAADPSAGAAIAAAAAADSAANATGGGGGDARWELLLCAPGCHEPLSGPCKAAAMAAFQQYSEAFAGVEEAAAAAAAAGKGGLASAGDAQQQQQQQLGQEVSYGAASSSSSSLGWHLRGRFDLIMQQQQQHAHDSEKAHTNSHQQQQQQQHLDVVKEEECRTAAAAQTSQDVSAWLASDATGSLRSAFAQGWACRERLQRAYDGFHSTDAAGITHVLQYTDLEGPNMPVPGGYQHLAELLAAEAEVQGVEFHLNCPVKKILWRRQDGKVAVQLASAAAAGGVVASRAQDDQITAAAAAAASENSGLRLFDAVVFTGSLGVLKAQACQLFDPPLPAAKAAAIQQLHIGQVEKLFVEWPAAAAGVDDHKAAGIDCRKQQQQSRAVRSSGALAVAAGATGAAASNSSPTAASALVGPRKPKTQPKTQLHDFCIEPPTVGPADEAAAAGSEAADCDSATAAAAAEQGRSSNSFTTYCLLWPTKEELWGRRWLAQQQQQQQQGSMTQVYAPDVPSSDPVYGDCFSASDSSSTRRVAVNSSKQQQQQAGALPTWLLGLHSWRYGDGPEWIKPPHTTSSSSSSAGQQQQHGSPGGCAVVWVTGRAAGQLQQLSDAQVLQHLEQLLHTFPAIPRPEGHHAGPEGSPDGPDSAQAESLAGPDKGPEGLRGPDRAQAGPERGPDSAQAGPDRGVAVGTRTSSTTEAQAGPEIGPEGQAEPDRGSDRPGSAQAGSLAGCTLLRSSWTTDERFLGSYSYPGPAANGETADVLAQPLSAADAAAAVATGGDSSVREEQQQDALVCFAGEATSRQHMGTVHGACMSGVREAERLLAQWGLA